MDERPILILSQIGINETLWKNYSLDKFGVLGIPMDEEEKTILSGMTHINTINNGGRIIVGSIAERNYIQQNF